MQSEESTEAEEYIHNISMLRQLFASHDKEKFELPFLDISDTSTSAREASAREDVSSTSSDEEGYSPRRKFSSLGDDSDEHSVDYVRGRRQRGQRPHRGEAADAAIDLSTRSESRCFSRRESRSSSPPTTAKARRSRSSHARFSYSSRRSSLGGTTVYQTAYMASLDAYLNTTSGLRLQPNGKCIFTFEKRRIVIKCATPEDGGDGDYTLYLCIGPMKELQVKYRSKILLKLMASWNEELKQRCLRRERRRVQGDDDQEISSSGLLQIDSTKPGDANVAFIYYGHVDDIKNAAQFQFTLDDFVDDALYLFDRIINDSQPDVGIKNCNYDSQHSHMTRSLPSFHAEKNHDRPNFHRNKNPSRVQLTSVCKSATVADPLSPAFNTSNSDVSTSNEIDMENSSKSIFSRMISSLRSKSGEISFSPHIGLGNQEQDCYVVDRHAIEAGNVKPTIVLTRVGTADVSEKSGVASRPEELQLTVRRPDERRGRRDCSRPRRRDCHRIDDVASIRGDRPRQRRQTTFDNDVDDRDYPCHEAPRRKTEGADDINSCRQSTKQITSSRPHRKCAVFSSDDFSDCQKPVQYRR